MKTIEGVVVVVGRPWLDVWFPFYGGGGGGTHGVLIIIMSSTSKSSFTETNHFHQPWFNLYFCEFFLNVFVVKVLYVLLYQYFKVTVTVL